MNRVFNPTVLCVVSLPLLVAGGVAAVFALDALDPPRFYRYAVALVLAYFIGSIPWGYWLMHWRRGIDLREWGSGRTGMTNVLRTGGGKMAAVVLLLDLGKGLAAVILAREVVGDTAGEVAAGLLALVGHNWPVFLAFRGGRGIATGFGGLLVMAPIAAGIAAIAFLPVALLSRYLSLGSIVGVIVAVGSLLALAWLGMYSAIYGWYVVIGGAIIIWQHRDNIQRLMQGTERRLGAPAARID